MLLEDLFEMGGGYVLEFSKAAFSRFFADELQVDIDDAAFSENGGSKGKRLRCFLRKADKTTVARVGHVVGLPRGLASPPKRRREDRSFSPVRNHPAPREHRQRPGSNAGRRAAAD